VQTIESWTTASGHGTAPPPSSMGDREPLKSEAACPQSTAVHCNGAS